MLSLLTGRTWYNHYLAKECEILSSSSRVSDFFKRLQHDNGNFLTTYGFANQSSYLHEKKAKGRMRKAETMQADPLAHSDAPVMKPGALQARLNSATSRMYTMLQPQHSPANDN
jgi:hypothetical protein